MTKVVQLVGGSADNQDQYIGPPRELTVDESNHQLRLHDGSTPGGHRLSNEAHNDTKYQAKSIELDGIDFEPLDVGFLVRVAPGDIRLRKLQVDTNTLSIVNFNGVDSEFISISLNQNLIGNRTITGQLTVTGGIISNLTGNILGNVTGNVLGNLTGDVTGDLLGNTFGTHTGSVDVTDATIAFDDDQIPLAAIDQTSLIALIKLHSVPSKTILAFYGLFSELPAGFFVCDGSNGTPDLRNKFILGASVDGDVGVIGGNAAHSHTASSDLNGAHAHTINVIEATLTIDQMPGHTHNNGICDAETNVFNHGNVPAVPATFDSVSMNNSDGTIEGVTSQTGGGLPHSHLANSGDAGAHTHSVTVDSSSSYPPHRQLYYIMKG